MEMVTYLNEYPTAILGGFDPSYLDLPEEILDHRDARPSEIFRAGA